MESQVADPMPASATPEPRENESQCTPPSSPANSVRSPVIPPDPIPLYDLRKKSRMPATTYQDNDKSGNYDPAAEAKKAKMNKMFKNSAFMLRKKNNGRKSKQKEVEKYIERFRFKDGKRFKEFKKLVESSDPKDKWPPGYADSDEVARALREAIRESRKRRPNTPDLTPQAPIDDPSGEHLDLTGHPSARGCVSCRMQGKSLGNGNECSMITDHRYPCEDCKLQKQTCRPIVSNFDMSACKKCKEDGETCSRREDPDQEICDYCGDAGYECETTAPKEHISDRIDIYKTMGRPNPSCSHCRAAGQDSRCSLKINKREPPPCKRCKRKGLGCTFLPLSPEEISKASDKKRKRGEEEEDPAAEKHNPYAYFTKEEADQIMQYYERESNTRASTPEDSVIEDTMGRKGVARSIRSCFGHPVEFQFEEGLDAEEKPCEFCEQVLFHISGHGERKVETIFWEDRFYTEIGPGHSATHGPTRMCHSCVTSRIVILSCPCDEIKPIPDPLSDFDEAVGELVEAQVEGSEQFAEQLQKWCTMCFSLASHACVSVQTSDEEGAELSHGCGLRLCLSCEVALREEFEGDLSAMARMMDGLPKLSVKELRKEGPSQGCMRADVGFLRDDGILMAAILAETDDIVGGGEGS